MAILAIVNPSAGQRSAHRIWQQLRAGPAKTWDCAITERPSQARELARTATEMGYERVVAIGGDGTIGEVASGLAHSATVLGIVAAGTGNDTAHNLNIPRDPSAAAVLAVTGEPRPLDVCRVETPQLTTCFVNVAGFGFDADVAWRVNRMPKLLGGTLPYVVGVLQTLWRYKSPGVNLRIDGQQRERRVFLVAVANCPSYGGGMRIAPAARPDDGLLDVCIVYDLSRFEVVRMLPRLYSGGHVNHPAVEIVRCRSVSADADYGVLCHADGELVGGLPARFELKPGALHCVTGPATHVVGTR